MNGVEDDHKTDIIHCVSKRFPFLNSLQLCQISANFHNLCTAGKRMEFATKPVQHYPPHLRQVATLPCEIKKSIVHFCRYSADMKENANKVHFKCTDFNFSMRVAVYAKCFYVLAGY